MVFFAHGSVFGKGAEGVREWVGVGDHVFSAGLAGFSNAVEMVLYDCCCLESGEFKEGLASIC